MSTCPDEPEDLTLDGTTELLVSLLAQWNCSDIRAIGVGGSRAAQRPADRYADLDLFILVRNGAAPTFIRRLPDLLQPLGRVLLVRGPVFVPNYGHSMTVIFSPAVCCQLNINDDTTLEPHHCRKHTRILFDRDGYLTLITTQSATLEIDRRRVFEEATAMFWHRVLDTARDLRRQQHWMAIRHLSDARQQLLTFARLAAGADPLDYYLVEKRIEHDLGALACAQFEMALPRYDGASIEHCLTFAVTWVNTHAPRLALALGANYPLEAAENLTALVANLPGRSGHD